MTAFYSKKGAEAGLYLEVTFDGEEVSLEIPEDGITMLSGWSILPLVSPMKVRISVSKVMFMHVTLSFMPGNIIVSLLAD